MAGDAERQPRRSDAPLTNARLASALAEIADLLEIRGDPPFKVAAYRRAADSVARSVVDVARAYRGGRPPELRGVGETIATRLAELSLEGRSAYHEALRTEVPASLLDLLAIPGVGPRTAGEVWRQLGIATLTDLEAAARAGRLRAVRGMSAATEARILTGLAELSARPPRRMLMDEAQAVAGHVVELVEALPDVISATVTGSLRRGCETVGDLDVLVETEQPSAVMAALAALPALEPETLGETVAGRAPRARRGRAWLRLHDGPRLDVMTMSPGVAGSYLVHFTGSAEHNTALRGWARRAGWSLSEHGLAPLDAPIETVARTFATEAELYGFLGLAEIPPELREGRGEIEAAASGTLPRLVERADLRGDTHSHTDWSDGRASLDEMVQEARRSGREYQVLTDHTVGLAVANGLEPRRVEEQRRVIGTLAEAIAAQEAAGEPPHGANADGFRLLHGCELEITPDGRLDYDPDLLATFDVVVASLHVGRSQPRARLMARYETAMRSPHVDIISHPSGRKIGQRAELDLDWEAFYRLAAETGTLLEINGSPPRLDLDAHRIRAARQAGCRFVVASDAHDPGEWRHLDYGVTMARRGWLEAADVANTLPVGDFLALILERATALGG